MSLGNHELDDGVKGLIPFIKNLKCPVLAANLNIFNVPELKNITNLKKSFVLNILEKSIGVVGYLSPETQVLSPKNDIKYIDEVKALKKEVKKMKINGVDIIIALGHSGLIKDLEIAKSVKGIDLVIGGHTNTFLWNGKAPDLEEALGQYPTYVTQKSGIKVPVVQSYAYTKYLGKLHMVFNSKGKFLSANGKPILLDNSIPQDNATLDIVEHYREKIFNITEEVIGKTTVVLDGLSCQHKECNLGNLITDAMVYRYLKRYKGKVDPSKGTNALIAIVQGGAIRSSIAHAEMPIIITKGDLMTVLPFEGILVIVTVKGSIILEMLEKAVANLSNTYYPGEFLQVSGLRVTYNLTKEVGTKVVKVETKCRGFSITRYELLDVDRDYKVIVLSYVQQGGNGYVMLKGQRHRILDYNLLTSSEDYIRQYSPVNPQVEGRIIILNNNK